MTGLTKIKNEAENLSEYWVTGKGMNSTPVIPEDVRLYYRDDVSWQYWDVPFCHENYIFCLVLSGERTLTLDDRKYELSSGDAIFIPPYARQVFGGERRAFKAIMASFKLSAEENKLQSISGIKFRMKAHEQELLRKSTVCFKQWVNGEHYAGDECICYFSIMLRRIRNQLVPEISQQKFHDNDNPLFRRVIEYLAANRDHRVTLKELSRALHASGSTIRQDFKKRMKQSIGRYEMTRRLIQGKHMLRSTHLTTAEIALRCGFESGSAFLRALKRNFGKKSAELRKW